MSATITILPGAEAATHAQAVDDEVARLLAPRAGAKPIDLEGSQVDRTYIGRRVLEESSSIATWVDANLSRERRRELGHLSTLTLDIHARGFWKTEPDLDFDNWPEQLRACAERIVRRRDLVGAPLFELWSDVPKRHAALSCPVEIRATTVAEREAGIAEAREPLAAVIVIEQRKLRALRALQRVVEAMYSRQNGPSVLDDPKARAAFDRGMTVLDNDYCEGGSTTAMNTLSETAQCAETNLGIAGGQRQFVRGGSIQYIDQPHIPFPVAYLASEIAAHGLAEAAETR